MNLPSRNSARAFTLTELAIVLGVMGTVIGSIWAYAKSAHQAAKIEQTVEAISATVAGVQSAYGSVAAISGGNIVSGTTGLIAKGVIPAQIISAMNAGFADSPLAQVSNANGTFVVCSWIYDVAGGLVNGVASDKQCNSGALSQFFAIELTNLDYASCLAIATAVAPTRPSGLRDVWINQNGIVATRTGLPVAPAQASADCVVGSTTNTVDFVYSLRPPIY
jgi:type II secretory pathway pseudopilin PulG